MNYIGIGIHKKYGVACVQDERGQTLLTAIASNGSDAVRKGNGAGGDGGQLVLEQVPA
jgi:hypothetical protein